MLEAVRVDECVLHEVSPGHAWIVNAQNTSEVAHFTTPILTFGHGVFLVRCQNR